MVIPLEHPTVCLPCTSHLGTVRLLDLGNSPVSLTLGGYQEARFVNHGISFTLGSADNLPRSLVRGIEVSVQDGPSEPEGWNSSTEILSTWDNYFEALIDSTTPYLWLPDELCDKLEAAFNLTYNNTFELYTLTNDQYREFMKEDSISFTFSLSSFDNTDDFGQPLDAYGVVNITIPARAFTGTLQYPFMNAAIAYGDPAVPFFALRRASNTSTMIIGRSFLQESYIITKYDEAVFSIHQALFPNSSASDLVLTPIWQPGNNVYPGPPSRGGSGLSTAEKAGIAVGVIVGCLVAGIIGWLFYRRQRNKKNAGSETRSKGGESSDSPTVRGSLVSRIFSLLGRRKKSPKEGAVLEKVAEQPCEAPNTQIYELPAPIPPAELDGDDASSLNGDTLGAESTQSMSAYEVARRKMDRQLQGPAPAYTPPSDGGLIPAEKTDHVTTTLAIPPRLRTHPPSPPSSLSATDSGTANTNSLRPSLPSPITPRLDWTNRMGEPPSPLTSTNVGSSTHLSGPSLRPMSARSEAGSMTSSHISPTTDRFVEPSNLPLSVPMGQATVQRTPIEPSRVVLLGPLPDNVRLSRRNSGSRHADADVEAGPPDVEVHRGHRTYDSLGSNFTVDEELRLDLTRQMDQSSAQSTNQQSNTRLSQVQTQGLGTQRSSPNNGTEPSSPDSQGRINPGLDLVHVPQLAERRYSWEEER